MVIENNKNDVVITGDIKEKKPKNLQRQLDKQEKTLILIAVQFAIEENVLGWRNGRRASLRCQWSDPWEFESPLEHHFFIAIRSKVSLNRGRLDPLMAKCCLEKY